MAEEIWRPQMLFGGPQGLRFELKLDSTDDEGLAWGQGLVLLDGDAVRLKTSLEDAAIYLKSTYKVSTELLAWQINNSRAGTLLDSEDKTRLEQWKTGRADLNPEESFMTSFNPDHPES